MEISASHIINTAKSQLSACGDAINDGVSACRQSLNRAIARVQLEKNRFALQHPTLTRTCKSIGEFSVSTARLGYSGLKQAGSAIAQFADKTVSAYQAVRGTVERNCPNLAIAIKGISEFTVRPLQHTSSALGLSVMGLLIGESIGRPHHYCCAPPYFSDATITATLLGATTVGMGSGLTTASYNTAAYAVQLKGADQSPKAAAFVNGCDQATHAFKAFNSFMEEQPAILSIPYKAAVNTVKGFTKGTGLVLAGFIGSATLANHYDLRFSTRETLFESSLYGGYAYGMGEAAYDTACFAQKKLMTND